MSFYIVSTQYYSLNTKCFVFFEKCQRTKYVPTALYGPAARCIASRRTAAPLCLVAPCPQGPRYIRQSCDPRPCICIKYVATQGRAYV